MGTSIKLLIMNRWSLGNGETTASSFQTDHEASKSANFALSRTWRSTGVSAEWLLRDFGEVRIVGGVGIVGTNLTVDATFRVRVSNSSDMSSPLYDSGVVVFWERIYSAAENLTGFLSEFFDGAGLPYTETQNVIQEKVRVVYFPSEVTGRYVQVDFFDPTNAEGFIQVGYVYAGRVFEPSPDIYYGWKIVRNQVARMPQATCGQYWSAGVFRRVHISCTVALQRETDLLGQWFLMQYLTGVGGEFIVSLRRSRDSWAFYTTIYAKFSESSKNQNPSFKRFNIPLEIEEIIST